jgi:cobalt-zinc-cadmium efflux system outer membrane protein
MTKKRTMKKILIAVCSFLSLGAIAQTTLSLDSAVAMSLRHHPQLMVSQQELASQTALKKGSFSLPDPQFLLEAPTGDFFSPGIQQTFDNPLIYIQQSKVGQQQIALAEAGIAVSKVEVIKQVSLAYIELQYANAKAKLYFKQDSIFNALYTIAEQRYKAEDAGLLEKTSAQARAQEASIKYKQVASELSNANQQLAVLIGSEKPTVSATVFEKLPESGELKTIPSTNPFSAYTLQKTAVVNQQLKASKAKIAPGISIGYLNQAAETSPIAQRFQFGLTIPLWFWTHSSRIKAAKAEVEKTKYEKALVEQNLNSAWISAITNHQKHKSSLQYYENTGLRQSETLIDVANQTYTAGEIRYMEYLFALSQGFDILANYYDALRNYNASIIELNYLKGK